MNYMNCIFKNTCCLIMAMSVFVLLSCNKDDEFPMSEPVEVHYQMPSVSVPMEASSIITLPDGVSGECVVANSIQELYKNIPSQILDETPEYQKIDFNSSSLIIVKFRSFYKLQTLDYNIYKDETQTYKIRQKISVENVFQNKGSFVMSCIVTEKIPTNSKLIVEQSYTYL